jgi:imidazolonepropionase-like amidohydrolase
MQQMESKLPFLVECNEWQEVLRVQELAKSFGLRLACKMDGDAYQRIEAMKQAGTPLLIPLNFPSAFELSDPADAREIPLKDMWHWEAAPTNPAAVAKAKIPFAFTLSDGTKSGEFWGNLQKAIKYGLPADAALAALTTQPAQLLGLENRIGKLEAGMLANFFIADADVFAKEKSSVLETWVSGKQYIQQSIPEWDARGNYQIEAGDQSIRLFIKGSLLRPKISYQLGNDTLDGTGRINGRGIELSLPAQKGASSPQYKLIGLADANGNLHGEGSRPDGRQFEWKANKFAPFNETQDSVANIKLADLADLPSPRMPFTGYGLSAAPQQGKWLIKGATIWTNTSQGVLQDAEVLIADGKVQGVGKGLMVPPGAIVIDGKGMHLSPGIIDEHSHIAISKGVNEGSHAISAEVSIADVIDCEDINIYRQLSGGVTAAQLLHGSANPIGGRSAIIKLRWGATPEEMKFKEAPGFIKFALGENVKQTNWGEKFTSRYPQTRMGVEQFVRDQFQAALDYRAAQKAHAGNANGIPPRKDLQMEVLLEILDGKRFITCHSYVQSEIVMLMRVAESFGFKINTFTHILEGYKVASKLQQHGANASTFSDWWAYKYEVIDAIPYNAYLLNKAGVNVCINSDDAEMGRRLNQEAAKAVKYGGMSEEDALKMVTLNPAKALHVDAYVGSIEKGKQADLVLWTDHPLSVYATAQKTWIDGKLYFDREMDAAARKFVQEERLRLIQKMQSSPDGEKKKFEGRNGPQLYHCDTMGYEEE